MNELEINLKDRLEKAKVEYLKKIKFGCLIDEIVVEISPCKKKEHGDYTSNIIMKICSLIDKINANEKVIEFKNTICSIMEEFEEIENIKFIDNETKEVIDFEEMVNEMSYLIHFNKVSVLKCSFQS